MLVILHENTTSAMQALSKRHSPFLGVPNYQCATNYGLYLFYPADVASLKLFLGSAVVRQHFEYEQKLGPVPQT